MDINNLPKGEFNIIIEDNFFKLRDQNGKIIYAENSNGYWAKSEYDSNGKIIYAENSDGYWWKREYDSNGNMIYYENSTGIKYFYDSDGNEYTELEWMKKNQSCEGKIVTIEGKQYQLKSV